MIFIVLGILLCIPAGRLVWRTVSSRLPKTIPELVSRGQSAELQHKDFGGISIGSLSLARRQAVVLFCGLAVLGVALVVVGIDLATQKS